MKIEAGKCYMDAKGRKIGPMKKSFGVDVWYCQHNGGHFLSSGSCGGDKHARLIREWPSDLSHLVIDLKWLLIILMPCAIFLIMRAIWWLAGGDWLHPDVAVFLSCLLGAPVGLIYAGILESRGKKWPFFFNISQKKG